MKKKNREIALDAVSRKGAALDAEVVGYWMFWNGVLETGDRRSLKEIRDGLLNALRIDKGWDESRKKRVVTGLREAYKVARSAVRDQEKS